MRRADTTNLLRDKTDNLFTWSKQGIFLKKGFTRINLNELKQEEALDILDNLLDDDLTYTQRIDTKEVIEYLTEQNNLD